MEIKAPNYYGQCPRPWVFLAGSIEQGTALNWQDKVAQALNGQATILNPRRDDWDASWIQSIENEQFATQVRWELNAMESSNLVLMHFEPETKSPITLLELGLLSQSGRLIVHCPEGFWRKGNVDIVCERFGVKQVETINEMIIYAKMVIKHIERKSK